MPGRYVEEWGDEGHRKGYCLYKMGCKGPEATYNCPTVRWNDGTSWPVKVGPWLHCLRFASLLGYEVALLQAAAFGARVPAWTSTPGRSASG